MVLQLPERAVREDDGVTTDDLGPGQRAGHVPGRDTDKRPRHTTQTCATGPGALAPACGPIRAGTLPPLATGRFPGRTRAVSSPPRLGPSAVTAATRPRAGPAARPGTARPRLRPLRRHPVSPTRAAGGTGRYLCHAHPPGPSCWSPGDRGDGRRQRRPPPCSRAAGRTGDCRPAWCRTRRRTCNTTRRVEGRCCRPGRQASRTSRSPRYTASVARCGRSTPTAAARDPSALGTRPGDKVTTARWPTGTASRSSRKPSACRLSRSRRHLHLRAAPARPQVRRGLRRPHPPRRQAPPHPAGRPTRKETR